MCFIIINEGKKITRQKKFKRHKIVTQHDIARRKTIGIAALVAGVPVIQGVAEGMMELNGNPVDYSAPVSEIVYGAAGAFLGYCAVAMPIGPAASHDPSKIAMTAGAGVGGAGGVYAGKGVRYVAKAATLAIGRQFM